MSSSSAGPRRSTAGAVERGPGPEVRLSSDTPGSNSADANRLLDRLEHLRHLAVPEGLFDDIPPHRITRLRRQWERYFADGLRELPDNRRLAILAVCAVEWETFVADAADAIDRAESALLEARELFNLGPRAEG